MMNTPMIAPMIAPVIACMAIGPVCAAAGAAPAGRPIPLGLGPQLFIDDYLVAESTDLVRTTHQPETLPEPILPKAEVWHEMPLFYQQVIRDPDTGLFRMWYNIRNNTPNMWMCYAYAESDDGIHWRRPNLGISDIGGSTDNNIFKVVSAFGLGFVDEGEHFADPQRRYKMAYYGNAAAGMCVAFSADGLHWTDYEQNPVLKDRGWDPARKRYAVSTDPGDIMDGCWDPIRKRYIMCFVVRSQPEDGYKGKNVEAQEFRRLVGESVSEDFIHWKRPWRINVADPDEAGIWEFYGMKPYVRGNLYLGFLRILRDDLAAEPDGPVRGIGWTELCTSRDGENWTHYREPFLDRNPQPGTFDRAHAWFGDCVTVGDREYIYYCGYSEGHKVGLRQLGLGFLRKDGFVSRDAGTTRGYLRTPLVRVTGSGMTVNADVEGEMRVRILDGEGNPIAGFDWDDCAPIRGDSLRHISEWKGHLAALQGKPVRLEFALRKAKLYAFEFTE